MGCGLWGHTESDTTEVTEQQQQLELGVQGVEVRQDWQGRQREGMQDSAAQL